MRNVRLPSWGLLAILALLASCTHSPERGDSDSPTGAQLFHRHCASCHADDGRGNGAVAPLLSAPVPDLTRIAARRQGEFPDFEVFCIIDGQRMLSAHGTRHMPVWGYEFFGDDADDEVAHRQASEKVDRLVAYLRSLQRK